MDLGLAGRPAIVAGGSKGFGEASARRLAAEGADLFLVARNAEDLAAVATAIKRDHGVRVETLPADLLDPAAADRAVQAAVAAYGRVDILVSSVGASGGGLFWEIPDAVWQDSMALKFMANLRMMRAVVPPMLAQAYGRVVVIVGQLGRQPHPRLLPSAAANAALLSVIKGLADEVADKGIVVNAVNPGPSRTRRWVRMVETMARESGQTIEEVEEALTRDVPMGRFGEPDEIARHVCYLASDAAGFVTGTSITADGGWVKLPA